MSSSFLEKLKKSMGLEDLEQKEEKKQVKKNKNSQEKRVEVKEVKIETSEPEEKREERQTEVKKDKWLELEGQLAVDVYETDGELVIQSAIAGVKPEDLDISIEQDRLLIKGERKMPAEKEAKNYFYQECYWGNFSKEIILPVEIDPSRTEASMREGVLTIRLPKIEREKKRKIEVKG
jgi:HSP20 family protein